MTPVFFKLVKKNLKKIIMFSSVQGRYSKIHINLQISYPWLFSMFMVIFYTKQQNVVIHLEKG